MTNGHFTYQLALSRISELHTEAAARRLANEVAPGHRPGVPTLLVRWLAPLFHSTTGSLSRDIPR